MAVNVGAIEEQTVGIEGLAKSIKGLAITMAIFVSMVGLFVVLAICLAFDKVVGHRFSRTCFPNLSKNCSEAPREAKTFLCGKYKTFN